jgi:hypothetical protein
MHSITLGVSLTLAIFTITIAINNNNNPIPFAKGQEAGEKSQGQDSVTVLLDGKTIPSKSFIHLYDSTPSIVSVGHVAAHLPCNSGGDTSVKVVAGIAPDVSPLNLTRVDKLSVPGTVCMYHADIPQQEGTDITDIALLNPTEQSITLPDTTTIVIHVSEFGAGAE